MVKLLPEVVNVDDLPVLDVVCKVLQNTAPCQRQGEVKTNLEKKPLTTTLLTDGSTKSIKTTSVFGAKEDASAVSSADDVSSCYRIMDIPGKGTGVVATSRIFPGEIIMEEEPLVVMPDRIFQNSDSDVIDRFLERRLNNVSADEREQFLALSDCRSSTDKTYLGIFYTNDMTYGEDAALFLNMARANHSCVPNAEFVSRPDKGVQRLIAIYTIEQGEEICINYLPITEEGVDVKETRQKYLRQFYGFQCNCMACTAQGETLRTDEQTRENIKEVQTAGLEKQTIAELNTLIKRLFSINGKLSYILDILDVIYKKTEDVFSRYLEGVRGLSLAIQVHGEDAAEVVDVWRPRAFPDLLSQAQIEAEKNY